jgi:hypothetical protein
LLPPVRTNFDEIAGYPLPYLLPGCHRNAINRVVSRRTSKFFWLPTAYIFRPLRCPITEVDALQPPLAFLFDLPDRLGPNITAIEPV